MLNSNNRILVQLLLLLLLLRILLQLQVTIIKTVKSVPSLFVLENENMERSDHKMNINTSFGT